MQWIWELNTWPQFIHNTPELRLLDRKFLLQSGGARGVLNSFSKEVKHHFIIDILSTEGAQSAKIEGDHLERESLQSSIRRHFNLQTDEKKSSYKEQGIADLLFTVYDNFKEELTHEMLFEWHRLLLGGDRRVHCLGEYRNFKEPMQIVSNRYGDMHVYYEAPPSGRVYEEMDRFIRWFNSSNEQSILERASIAHIYFESIHPFEDGNGRLGRALVEKVLSQEMGHPTLLAISKVIEKRKKEYYKALSTCNRSVDASSWITFFSDVILQAQEESSLLIDFILFKSQIMQKWEGIINQRQTKVLLRLFNKGPQGFDGNLSAKNYISITNSSRATATRDLADLVSKEILLKTGQLRHTRYKLAYKSKGN